MNNIVGNSGNRKIKTLSSLFLHKLPVLMIMIGYIDYKISLLLEGQDRPQTKACLFSLHLKK